MACLSTQINSIDVNFQLQKSLEDFEKNSADKICTYCTFLWSQSEKLSEIKPPLKNHSVSKPKNVIHSMKMQMQIHAEFGPTLGR